MENNVALQNKRGSYYKDTKKTIGNLYQLRNERGLSLEMLADEIGVSRQAYSAWENGIHEIKSDILILLANYYDIIIDYLLGRSDCRNVDNDYIKRKTGLDDVSIDILSDYNDSDDRSKLWGSYLSYIIGHNKFKELFGHISELAGAAKIEGLAAANNDYNDTLQAVDDQTAQLYYIAHTFTSILEDLTTDIRLKNNDNNRK